MPPRRGENCVKWFCANPPYLRERKGEGGGAEKRREEERGGERKRERKREEERGGGGKLHVRFILTF
jgi:hypothetical protein